MEEGRRRRCPRQRPAGTDDASASRHPEAALRPLLRQHLDTLDRRTDTRARLAADPVAFVHRYRDPRDVEIAGLVASSLAYGRVDLFRPVLRTLFDAMDDRGGPAAFVAGFEPDHAAPFADVVYRWNRGGDFVILFAALRDVLARHGTLEALLAGPGPLADRLERAVGVLRDALVAAARDQGLAVGGFDDLPRGARYLFPAPSSGSACKRLNLWLRWMTRPADGVDLGVWTVLSPRDLIVPLDVHVARIARLVGLTRRRDASWRTAEEVTDALRRLDPDDPVRFDFALSHLGISGACRGVRDEAVCPDCPLVEACAVAAA